MVSSTDNEYAFPFVETVILVNGEVQADTNSLLENDNVLIIFKAYFIPDDRTPLFITPPCHNATIRTGCGFGKAPCSSTLRVPRYVPHLSTSMFYYFRPVLMSDNGLTISFTEAINIYANITYASVTLNGKSVCDSLRTL